MYTTKRLRELFHIGRDSIRYYEKDQVLKPKISPQNGYHYYNDLDIDVLARIIKLRGLDFSLDEVNALQNTTSTAEYLQAVSEKRQSVLDKINHYQQLAAYLDENEENLRHYLQHDSFLAADNFWIEFAYLNFDEFFDSRHEVKYNNYLDLPTRSLFAFSDFLIFLKPTDDYGRYFIDKAGTAFAANATPKLKNLPTKFSHYQYPHVFRSFLQQPITMHKTINLQKPLHAIYDRGFRLTAPPYLRQIAVLEKKQRILQLNVPVRKA